MELNYSPAESTVRQPEIEVGVTTVYLRRNFVQKQRDGMEGEEPTTIWVYDEAQLTKDEALYYLAAVQRDIADDVADADGINIDQEFRLTLLELGLTDAW